VEEVGSRKKESLNLEGRRDRKNLVRKKKTVHRIQYLGTIPTRRSKLKPLDRGSYAVPFRLTAYRPYLKLKEKKRRSTREKVSDMVGK